MKTHADWDKFVKMMDDAIKKLNKLLPLKTVSAKILMTQFYFDN